jgi:hypothetical protein
MKKQTSRTVRDLERESYELVATGKMPKFEDVLQAIEEARTKYRPLILAARKESTDVKKRSKRPIVRFNP